MADFKEMIELITKSVDRLNSQIPVIQRKVLDEILLLIKDLETRDGKIRIVGKNLAVLSKIQSRLNKIILSEEYVDSIKDYVKSFDVILKLQNQYFESVSKKFKPPKVSGELKSQAVESVANHLTETGMKANIVDRISDILRQSITTGTSYASMSKRLSDFLTSNGNNEGHLVRYVKQISTDAINQFSGQYTQLVSADLGFKWFRYSGTNLETSRPFCLACTDRKYFHISEIPKILKGDFPEFKKHEGKINKRTGLPTGMIEGTDVSNFMVFAGGYNCGHKWRPVTEELVPEEIRRRIKD